MHRTERLIEGTGFRRRGVAHPRLAAAAVVGAGKRTRTQLPPSPAQCSAECRLVPPICTGGAPTGEARVASRAPSGCSLTSEPFLNMTTAGARPSRAYSHVRFRAEVDFALIGLELGRPSNFATVRRLTGATYVTGIDESGSHAASRFLVRLDDPGSRVKVLQSLEPLRARPGGFSAEPALVGVEVALDCYSRRQVPDELLQMTERLFRYGTALCSANVRMTRKLGEVVWAEDAVLFRRRLAQGFTIVVGDTGDSIQQRIYLKRTDKNGAVKLPLAEHRARREVTLGADALSTAIRAFPGLGIEDSAPWRFEHLAEWFRFRRVRSGQFRDALAALLLQRQVVLGARVPGRSKRRLYDPRLQADAVLNELARGALRELSRRFALE